MEVARQITYGREDCKSRIYGLFPYLDWDENGNCSLHKATDDIVGCWGHVMPELKLMPFTDAGETYVPGLLVEEVDEDDNVAIHRLYYWGETVTDLSKVPSDDLNRKEIKENSPFYRTYSYRTIMSYYYRYANDEVVVSNNVGFFKFVEEGFGIEHIDKSELTGEGVEEKDLDLVPAYVNIVTCAWLVEQYRKVKYRCDVSDGLDDEKSYHCCICERYKRMGGDKMLDKLTELVAKADAMAETYLAYGVLEESHISLNVKLDGGTHDFGVLSAYLNPWIGGEKHYRGELYTYTDEEGSTNTWVCLEENTDYFDCETERFVFPKKGQPFSTWNDDDTLNKHVVGDIGYPVYFVKVTECEDPEFNWKNKKLSYEYYDKENKEIVKGQFGTTWDYDRTGEETIPTQVGDIDGDDIVMTESKLKSLRTFKDYINEYGQQEEPGDGEDWLFFYRKGHIVDYTMNTDENGNIEQDDTGLFLAFGNLITDIECDATEQTITFTYKMGVRLMPTGESTYQDDDGNIIKTYSEFIVDDRDTVHGVTYQETYRYEADCELADLIASGKFGEYITDDGDRRRAMTDEDVQMFSYNKYAFNTSDNVLYTEKRIVNSIVTIPYIPTRLEAAMDAEEDILYAPTFKTDYLNGITYEPIITNEVWIDRGINAMFDKHIKLGEVKTLQDMENYANGSVFVMQET